MNAQEQFWSGAQGDEYTERNFVDWWARVPFWSRIMARTLPRNVLEVGCNSGWNFMALRACWGDLACCGLDVNEQAVRLTRGAGFPAKVGGFDAINTKLAAYHPFDLVFTSGVLIHVAPENLQEAMARVSMASTRYVLAIEYEHGFEQEIEYRGEKQRLWKRPFGKMYEALGLKQVEYWPSVDGWDRCAAWLFQKP